MGADTLISQPRCWRVSRPTSITGEDNGKRDDIRRHWLHRGAVDSVHSTKADWRHYMVVVVGELPFLDSALAVGGDNGGPYDLPENMMDNGYFHYGAEQALGGQNPRRYLTEAEAVAAQHAVSQKMQAGGIQAVQPGLMDGLRLGHDLLDRLNAALSGLEERILPVLDANAHDDIGNDAQVSTEPPAIGEMTRILSRLQGAVWLVERIKSRIRL